MPPEAKLAGPADIAGMTDALCRAFADDPVFEYLAPGIEPAQRVPRLEAFFRVESQQKIKKATAWTTADRTGAALWAAPDEWRTSFTETLRLALPMLGGARSRIFKAMSLLQHIEKHHPKDAHWYLAVLGTDPHHQGKGVGAALLQPVLERCDTEALPAYLESSKEANVPYYERFGFRVTEELKAAPDAPTLWAMWREPQADGGQGAGGGRG